MSTTKRTTANLALTESGERIRLLATKAKDETINNLLYKDVREAVKNGAKEVNITIVYGPGDSDTYPVFFGQRSRYASQGLFSIGCHNFTLKMFNRILRAAGVRTTKAQTEKAYGAAAGR